MSLTPWLLIGYFIGLIIIFAYRTKNEDADFLIGNNNRPAWQILTSKYVGSMGASYFVVYTAYAYEFGWNMLMMMAGMLGGYILFAALAGKKIVPIAKEKKFLRLGDYVFWQTESRFISTTINMSAAIIHGLWIVVTVIGSAKLIEAFGAISYTTCVLLIGLFICAYLLRGGYMSVIHTDIYQALIMVVTLTIICTTLISRPDFTLALTSTTHTTLTPSDIFGLFLYGILSMFSQSDRYQLGFASRSVRHFQIGLSMAAIPLILTGLLLVAFGIYAFFHNPNLDPALVFSYLTQELLPIGIHAIVIILLICALMSSLDTYIYATATLITPAKKTSKLSIQKNIIFICLTTIILSLIFRNIIDITVLAAGITLTLSIPMISILSGNRSPASIGASIFVGYMGCLTSIFFFGFTPAIATFILIGSLLGLCFHPTLGRILLIMFWIRKE